MERIMNPLIDKVYDTMDKIKIFGYVTAYDKLVPAMRFNKHDLEDYVKLAAAIGFAIGRGYDLVFDSERSTKMNSMFTGIPEEDQTRGGTD
jgi:hypothetical protein